MNNEKNRYSELINFTDEMAFMVHDFNKHLRIIRFFIDKQEYAECQKYLSDMEIKNQSTTNYECYLASNKAANNILNMKIKEAKENGIEVNIDASIFKEIAVKDIDLCLIIGNAMDNAINACQKYSGGNKKFISIKINNENNKLFFSIINSSNEVLINNQISIIGEGRKANGNGFGIKIMKEIIETNNGILRINYHNCEFRLDILFFSI